MKDDDKKNEGLQEKLLKSQKKLLDLNVEKTVLVQKNIQLEEKLSDANKTIAFLKKEQINHSGKIVIANEELAHQILLKEKREMELLSANEELANQIDLKEKRALELAQVNEELAYQNELKEKRAAELLIANEELALQNELKEKRAEELVIAKEKAESSDLLKTAFINNISHEIRTPLNSILGFAPFVVKSDVTLEEKEEYLGYLNISGERLMDTVTDIMDISLLISGNMKIHPQQIDISLMLTDVIENFEKACMEKDLELIMSFPDNSDKTTISTDGELLQKAVFQLVDNSVKFTKNGSITLGYELKNNNLEIFVRDTGKGIGEKSKEKIFHSFEQEYTSNSREHNGTGLGLSIAEGIMQLLGGKIWLESKKNEGTGFFLSLPFDA